MERAPSLVLAAVLSVALAVAPVAATSQAAPATPAPDGGPASVGTAPSQATAAGAPPSPSNNTTARLVLPRYRIEQTHFRTVRIGLSGTLQVGADSARFEHRRVVVREDFETADSVEERRNVVDRALIDLSERASDLEARERAATRDYSNGNITTETLVRRLARIDARAREVENTLGVVRSLTDRIGTTDFDTRIRDVSGVVESLRGPVRARAYMALSGESNPVRIHVTASDRGLVLAMLDEGLYVREATRWSNRNASAPSTLDFGDVGERFEELYPWVTTQQGGTSISWQGAGAWQLQASHPQGVLTASVDASKADVYREVQTLTLDELPNTMTLVRIDEGIRVSFGRTYSGGPLRLLIEDASTDAVVNARVTVDGHDLGRIGADGLVVTMEPRPPYTVNVTTDGSSASFVMDEPFNDSRS